MLAWATASPSSLALGGDLTKALMSSASGAGGQAQKPGRLSAWGRPKHDLVHPLHPASRRRHDLLREKHNATEHTDPFPGSKTTCMVRLLP
jgi:hypothetical protein